MKLLRTGEARVCDAGLPAEDRGMGSTSDSRNSPTEAAGRLTQFVYRLPRTGWARIFQACIAELRDLCFALNDRRGENRRRSFVTRITKFWPTHGGWYFQSDWGV